MKGLSSKPGFGRGPGRERVSVMMDYHHLDPDRAVHNGGNDS